MDRGLARPRRVHSFPDRLGPYHPPGRRGQDQVIDAQGGALAASTTSDAGGTWDEPYFTGNRLPVGLLDQLPPLPGGMADDGAGTLRQRGSPTPDLPVPSSSPLCVWRPVRFPARPGLLRVCRDRAGASPRRGGGVSRWQKPMATQCRTAPPSSLRGVVGCRGGGRAGHRVIWFQGNRGGSRPGPLERADGSEQARPALGPLSMRPSSLVPVGLSRRRGTGGPPPGARRQGPGERADLADRGAGGGTARRPDLLRQFPGSYAAVVRVVGSDTPDGELRSLSTAPGRVEGPAALADRGRSRPRGMGRDPGRGAPRPARRTLALSAPESTVHRDR